MRLVEAAKPVFARHETFHPRYGWFRKAYAQVAKDPRAFFGDDAPVRLGVGKNMVRAIRFWGLAAKLIEEDPNSTNRRAPDLRTTELGDSLFGKGGWDEYMEDPGTLWLLHWLLLAPPCYLPVWWIAFQRVPRGGILGRSVRVRGRDTVGSCLGMEEAARIFQEEGRWCPLPHIRPSSNDTASGDRRPSRLPAP